MSNAATPRRSGISLTLSNSLIVNDFTSPDPCQEFPMDVISPLSDTDKGQLPAPKSVVCQNDNYDWSPAPDDSLIVQ